ncbi:MAG: hypothetical protein AAB368_11485 [bacterium]
MTPGSLASYIAVTVLVVVVVTAVTLLAPRLPDQNPPPFAVLAAPDPVPDPVMVLSIQRALREFTRDWSRPCPP